jgi:cold shock CspA family protein
MIAYVDENGFLTDTPPTTEKKEHVRIEDIEISVPPGKRTETATLKGRVEYFNEEKGYGFIKHLASVDKYFFHVNDCHDTVGVGSIVSFELERKPKGLNAVNVTVDK